jgi:drug/metabolite transporter (DMT)-like permease
MPPQPGESTRSGLGSGTALMFALAVLIGGSNFVAVRVSNRYLLPFWGAGLRFLLASVLFVAIAFGLRLAWPRGRQLALVCLYGVLSFALSYALMYWALVRVSAGLAAVVLAAVPLVTILLAAAQKLEPLSSRVVVGALLALGGIVWKTVDPAGLILPLGGLLAMVAATFTVGQSVIIGKRISENHPVMNNAVGMLAAVPVLLAISMVAGETWVLPRATEAVLTVVYLSTVGSVGLFVLFLVVIRRWTASATSYSFVLFPVVAMVLESIVDGVPLTLRSVSAALIVMAGVWFGLTSGGKKDRPVAREALPS